MASNSSSHLVVTGRASILILIIVVGVTIIVLRCLWKRRGRCHEATKASLLSGNTADTGVHLTQLITECVKASIHALKLCQDDLKGHTTRADEKGAKEAEGVTFSICGHFGRSWASLCLKVARSMAHTGEKCVDLG